MTNLTHSLEIKDIKTLTDSLEVFNASPILGRTRPTRLDRKRFIMVIWSQDLKWFCGLTTPKRLENGGDFPSVILNRRLSISKEVSKAIETSKPTMKSAYIISNSEMTKPDYGEVWTLPLK